MYQATSPVGVVEKIQMSAPYLLTGQISSLTLKLWAILQCHHVPDEAKKITKTISGIVSYDTVEHANFVVKKYSNTKWGSISKAYLEWHHVIHDDRSIFLNELQLQLHQANIEKAKNKFVKVMKERFLFSGSEHSEDLDKSIELLMFLQSMDEVCHSFRIKLVSAWKAQKIGAVYQILMKRLRPFFTKYDSVTNIELNSSGKFWIDEMLMKSEGDMYVQKIIYEMINENLLHAMFGPSFLNEVYDLFLEKYEIDEQIRSCQSRMLDLKVKKARAEHALVTMTRVTSDESAYNRKLYEMSCNGEIVLKESLEKLEMVRCVNARKISEKKSTAARLEHQTIFELDQFQQGHAKANLFIAQVNARVEANLGDLYKLSNGALIRNGEPVMPSLNGNLDDFRIDGHSLDKEIRSISSDLEYTVDIHYDMCELLSYFRTILIKGHATQIEIVRQIMSLIQNFLVCNDGALINYVHALPIQTLNDLQQKHEELLAVNGWNEIPVINQITDLTELPKYFITEKLYLFFKDNPQEIVNYINAVRPKEPVRSAQQSVRFSLGEEFPVVRKKIRRATALSSQHGRAVSTQLSIDFATSQGQVPKGLTTAVSKLFAKRARSVSDIVMRKFILPSLRAGGFRLRDPNLMRQEQFEKRKNHLLKHGYQDVDQTAFDYHYTSFDNGIRKELVGCHPLKSVGYLYQGEKSLAREIDVDESLAFADEIFKCFDASIVLGSPTDERYHSFNMMHSTLENYIKTMTIVEYNSLAVWLLQLFKVMRMSSKAEFYKSTEIFHKVIEFYISALEKYISHVGYSYKNQIQEILTKIFNAICNPLLQTVMLKQYFDFSIELYQTVDDPKKLKTTLLKISLNCSHISNVADMATTLYKSLNSSPVNTRDRGDSFSSGTSDRTTRSRDSGILSSHVQPILV